MYRLFMFLKMTQAYGQSGKYVYPKNVGNMKQSI